jgi:hypothetical protein
MKSLWQWAGLLALAACTDSIFAQVPSVIHTPAKLSPPTFDDSDFSQPIVHAPEPTVLPQTCGATSEPSCGDGTALANKFMPPPMSAVAGATVLPAVSVGPGLTSASINSPSAPVVLPGLLTATYAESAVPLDRVYFNYSYMNGFQTFQNQIFLPEKGTGNPPLRQLGFNLNTFDVGAEKTFFDGRVSIYASVPFLDAADNTTTLQAVDGLGDVAAGFKVVLWCDPGAGDFLTAGLTVSTPTGRETTLPEEIVIHTTSTKFSTKNPLIYTTLTETELNPTYFQPWTAGLVRWDQFFVQDYVGIVVASDSRVSTFVNNDLTVGYMLYDYHGGGWLTGVTPTIDLQALLPVNHVGTPRSILAVPKGIPADLPAPSVQFSDQLFTSAGIAWGLGDQVVLSTSAFFPVVAPRSYCFGLGFGLNFFY